MASDYEIDSEVEETLEEQYKLLRKGRYTVKVDEDKLKCPFCPDRRKQFYKYKELLEHTTMRKNAEQRGKHLALRKYLKTYLSPQGGTEAPISSSLKQPEVFYVWPWVGIVIKPVTNDDNTSMLPDATYWSDKLARFSPLEVKPLWIEKDSAVAAVIKFNSSFSGFERVTKLETEFEVNHRGKKDWLEKRGPDWSSKTYGWCAREEDYNSHGLIAEYLSSVGELRSVSEIANDKKQKMDMQVEVLNKKNAMKNEDLSHFQCKNSEKIPRATRYTSGASRELTSKSLDATTSPKNLWINVTMANFGADH